VLCARCPVLWVGGVLGDGSWGCPGVFPGAGDGGGAVYDGCSVGAGELGVWRGQRGAVWGVLPATWWYVGLWVGWCVG
jgi:hypothetical protein